MQTQQSNQSVITDWIRNHWKLAAAFTSGVLLGAFAVRQGYEGFRIQGSEYVLIKKASIPKSLSIKGTWFYETETSGLPMQYDNLQCTKIMGKGQIFQAEASNEFRIEATRKLCVKVGTKPENITTNVGWTGFNASVLPDNRKIIVALSTRDIPPRIGYIEGEIPERLSGDSPTEFGGNMYYLNTKDKTFNSTTITFCKEGTECALIIANQLKPK